MQHDKKPIPVIFILGSGHCGSTLLDLLLDMHPDIMGVGEIDTIHKGFICTCGKGVDSCLYWKHYDASHRDTKQVYRSKFNMLLRRRQFFYAVNGDVVNQQEYAEWYHELIDGARKEKGACVVVDSSKNPDHVALLAESALIRPYIIHLVRDGRANTWSYVRKYGRVFPFFFQWFLSNIKIELLHRELAVPYMRIRYEDFVTDPQGILRKIITWVGLVTHPISLDFGSVTHHHIGGNRLRFKKTKIQKDNSWKRDMPRWQQYCFTLFFGWLNFYYHLG